VESFQEGVLEGADNKTKNFLIFLFGCIAWRLWLIRNNFVFRSIVVSSPDVSVYRVLSFMEKWEVMIPDLPSPSKTKAGAPTIIMVA
jgi:hypothetical protein